MAQAVTRAAKDSATTGPETRGCLAAGRIARRRSDCDEACAATACCEADRPADEDEQPILEADQVPEVDDEPGRPGEKAAEPDALDVGDGRRSADRGKVALVAIP